ncbi:hypothetical protein BJY00DRAFT_58884 [Aspergillus carlsbadensis]|nr:hypothetical protein BJY00DRAFT_58884 [Aspergillus carlsbadensis]
MPTGSSLFEYSITNWGPLPTDFTLPASCLSSTNWALAWTVQPSAPLYFDCNQNTEALCAPTPTDSGALETALAINEIPGDGLIGPYYSPGVACPADWTTVGVAVRGESTVSRSGIVATPTADEEDEDEDGGTGDGALPTFYNNHDVLIDLLDVGETAVWCCPESATAFTGGGVCLSAISDYSFSTGCRSYYGGSDVATYTTGIPGNDGQTTEGEMLIITATTTATVETTTFPSSETTEYIAYSQFALIRFVHQPSDLAESGGGDDEGEEEGDSGSDPSETNAAERIGGTGASGGWGGMVGSLLASVVAGAALVLVR